MKNIFIILAGLMTVGSAYAENQFTCFTKAEDRYYVKKIMKLKIIGKKSIFVQPYDSDEQTLFKGSVGKLDSKDVESGWARFSGFNSSDMFGDLSEGLADEGIYVYISPEIQSGKNGPASLYARGTEVGLEKASYYCKKE